MITDAKPAKQPEAKNTISATPEVGKSTNLQPNLVGRNIYANIKAEQKSFSCETCGVDLPNERYHCSKNGKIDVCATCYGDGRFSSSLFAGDFVKMAAAEPENDWNDQETLLLLEGVELFREDWSKVAEHVGTRTRDECLLKFLQLPIQDVMIGESPDVLGPLKYNRIPFSGADNPVLSLAAFLASVVDPNVAKAAAKAAVDQLKQISVKNEPSSPSKSPSHGSPTRMTGVVSQQPISPTKKKVNALPHPAAKAAGVAFGSAAAKAYALAQSDQIEMEKLTRVLIETQLTKMELKLAHFQEMELLLESEKRQLEKERQKLFADRVAMHSGAATSPRVAQIHDAIMEDAQAELVSLN